MFISKLVCDKCNTIVDEKDKFCKECGTKGVKDEYLTSEELEELLMKAESRKVRCRSCGKEYDRDQLHKCSGLFQKLPQKFYDDYIKWDVGVCTNEVLTKLL